MRGKTETTRAQYMNTKDVRVTISTWNVAGRVPNENLDIDVWISSEEPLDIYIFGSVLSIFLFIINLGTYFQCFQEVPLNTGNIFGAEGNKPIPKWEAIIRRTRNKSLEPESKHNATVLHLHRYKGLLLLLMYLQMRLMLFH